MSEERKIGTESLLAMATAQALSLRVRRAANKFALRKEWKCCSCKNKTFSVFMVHDHLWRQTGYAIDQLVCLPCFEAAFKLTMQRDLELNDFTVAPCNDLIRWGWRRGKRALRNSLREVLR
jgi:hypothetical protein